MAAVCEPLERWGLDVLAFFSIHDSTIHPAPSNCLTLPHPPFLPLHLPPLVNLSPLTMARKFFVGGNWKCVSAGVFPIPLL